MQGHTNTWSELSVSTQICTRGVLQKSNLLALPWHVQQSWAKELPETQLVYNSATEKKSPWVGSGATLFVKSNLQINFGSVHHFWARNQRRQALPARGQRLKDVRTNIVSSGVRDPWGQASPWSLPLSVFFVSTDWNTGSYFYFLSTAFFYPKIIINIILMYSFVLRHEDVCHVWSSVEDVGTTFFLSPMYPFMLMCRCAHGFVESV